jgi:cadherin EGF LAG seven-pass G-type receptor 1
MQVQVGQNSSAIVSLRNGILYYNYNSEPMFLSGTNLADGQWHRIEIKWLGTEVSMAIDYGQRIGYVPMTQKIQGLYVGKIVIGSPDPTIGNIGPYRSFEGCVQDVRVGSPQAVLNRPTIRENVIDGCASKAECPDMCPDHSSCKTTWDEAHCDCLSGYVGADCAQICTVKPCADAGICRIDPHIGRGYHCECNDTLHSGEYCETIMQKPCPGGWWGERSCGPCKCNIKQGYHPDCDKATGACRCRENHYQPPNETACLPCDCYSIGSFGGSCNTLNGQCECRDGVIGRRCDSCSNNYAEVTQSGCEVIYDACPKSFLAGQWWPRTAFGQTAVENCPSPAKGKGNRICDITIGGWGAPDMYNCTSEPFIELRKQLSQMEKQELELNTFVAVKMAADLQRATEVVGNLKHRKNKHPNHRDQYSFESSFISRNSFWTEDFDIDYLPDEHKFVHDGLYGADLLITEGVLQELLSYEIMQSGLNLSHSQDKYFIKNLVDSASVILDERYTSEWKRLTELTQRGPSDLVDAFNKYMVVLARSQHDTYTNPFEIVHTNMALGLDIVTAESLFGYEPQQLNDYHKNFVAKTNQFTTESVIIPDTSAFLQHSSKQKMPLISFPKYNNYIQDKSKFDRHSRILIPLDMLGIVPPEKDEVTQSMTDYRAIISYAQYKEAGDLFLGGFDETVTRRWGVEVQIASPVLSLAILVPSTANDEKRLEMEKKIERIETNDVESISTDNEKEKESAKITDDNSEEIKITVHDLSEHDTFGLNDIPELIVHMNNDDGDENVQNKELEDKPEKKSENEATYADDYEKRVIKRSLAVEVSRPEVEHNNQKLIYRTLGSPHLSQPIKVQIWLDLERKRFGARSNPQCVRWNSFTNLWTRIGCQTEIPDYEALADDLESQILINCTCTHISNYAVLVDVIDPEDIPEPSLLMQITSYSAFLISLPVLFGVILALALLRGMQTNSNTIHQNLVFCIFIAELLFFVAMQARKELVENEVSFKKHSIICYG